MTESENQNVQDNPSSEPAPDVDTDVEAAAAPAESLEQQITRLEQEKAEVRERMLRIAAEFENWKKRSRKDLADSAFKAKEAVLRDVLEVIDNLERAVASAATATDPKPVVDGVNLVLRLFQHKLERHDVHPIEARGKAFDPHVHEAVSRVATSDVPVGGVVDELVRGYRMGERLLRPAAVVVAIAPPEPAAPAEPTAGGGLDEQQGAQAAESDQQENEG